MWWCIIIRQCVLLKKMVHYLQCQGHSKGWYDQNMTLSTISSELLILWQPNLICWYISISQSVFWKKIGWLLSSSRSQQRSKYQLFVQMRSSKPPHILLPNLVLWCITMSRSACKKIDVLFSRSRSQQGLMWSKYDSFYYIILTVDSLAAKLGLMIHHQKPECPMKKKWITAFRVKVKAKGQNLMFVQMISSKPSNILFSNLVLWFIFMSQCCAKRLLAIFMVKVTARALVVKIWQFLLYLLNCWSFCYQTWFYSTLS